MHEVVDAWQYISIHYGARHEVQKISEHRVNDVDMKMFLRFSWNHDYQTDTSKHTGRQASFVHHLMQNMHPHRTDEEERETNKEGESQKRD